MKSKLLSVVRPFLLASSIITLLICFLSPNGLAAKPDYIFFSINGDTTGATLTQADLFAWGSNCDFGATINWEIWYDVNSNSVIEPSIDVILTSESITDGDPLSEYTPVLDGFAIGDEFILSGETGNYIFRAKDIATDATFQRVATMTAMSSPPIQVSGQISVPGYSPPNTFLANRIIFADAENSDGAYFAATDNMGMYTLEMDASVTDSTFYFDASVIPGFVSPESEMAVVSGIVNGVNFTYLTATDSVYGYIKDDLGTVIDIKGRVNAEHWSDGERESLTDGGRYVIYFSDADIGAGDWYLNIDDGIYGSEYLSPPSLEFSRDTIGTFEYDFVLYRADEKIYARVTEEGELPVHQYIVEAYSMSLNTWTQALSGIGADNVATLHVSSLDPSGWFVTLNQWDQDFPIPPQFISIDVSENVSPGDTVALNLSSSFSCCVGDRGNANGDPEDKVNITDITYLIQYLFGVPTGPAPPCTEEGNANGDPEEKLNITDITYLIQYLFGVPSGPPPPGCPISSGPSWQTIFEDNFDGDSLNTENWTQIDDTPGLYSLTGSGELEIEGPNGAIFVYNTDISDNTIRVVTRFRSTMNDPVLDDVEVVIALNADSTLSNGYGLVLSSDPFADSRDYSLKIIKLTDGVQSELASESMGGVMPQIIADTDYILEGMNDEGAITLEVRDAAGVILKKVSAFDTSYLSGRVAIIGDANIGTTGPQSVLFDYVRVERYQ